MKRIIVFSWLIFSIIFFTLNPINALTLLLDNFDSGELLNNFERNTGCWSCAPDDKSQSIYSEFVKPGANGTGNALRLTYDIQSDKNYIEGYPGTAFNGYFSILPEVDLTKYDYLTFFLRGVKDKGFTRKFKIELKSKDQIGSYTIKWVPDNWEQIIIPLWQFEGLKKFNKITEMTIVFDQNVTRKEGAIEVDDFVFISEIKREKAIAKKINQPIKIDGNLEDWKNAKKIHIDVKHHKELGYFDGKDDLDAYAYFLWDDENLYFAIEVYDDKLLCREKAPDMYKDDSVELFIDPQNNGLEWGNKEDIQIGFSPFGPDNKPQVWAWFQDGDFPEFIKVASTMTKTKKGFVYIIESAVSWKFLQVKPQKGLTIGVSPAINDQDGKPSESGKLNWSYQTEGSKVFLGVLKLE